MNRPVSKSLEASMAPRAEEMDAYERLFGDAMKLGIPTLFAREDSVEEAWRIVDPVLKADTPVAEDDPNTWGPALGESVTPPGGWQNPVTDGPGPQTKDKLSRAKALPPIMAGLR